MSKKAKYTALISGLLLFTGIATWVFEMEFQHVALCLMFIGLLAIVLVMDYFRPPPSLPGLVKKWMDENGYAQGKIERRLIREGPFIWETGRGSAVFRIAAVTSSGSKSGWLKLTCPLPIGLGRTHPGRAWSVTVIWDDDDQKRIRSSVIRPVAESQISFLRPAK